MTTTAQTTIQTLPFVREYRVQRTITSPVQRLLARVRGDRAALESWRLQPATPRPIVLQEEIVRAQLRMLAR